jgi:UDP-N-acetylglucosamine--N-acetylmuramyl-(pentapeptide) pyrophosphoryl-undecaprenol N-acetylglucosamine transferase
LKNAQALASEGASVVISEKELSGKLFSTIDNLLRDEQKLRQMEENSLRLSRIDAAAAIVDNCIKLMAKRN